MTLTEFLLARIAEDEERARSPYLRTVYVGQTRADVRDKAECEAKRRIVVAWLDAAEEAVSPFESGMEHGLHAAVVHLARVYADHPDYDEAWRP